MTAPHPTKLGWLTLNGRSISGSVRRNTKKDIETKRNAMVTAKLPLLTNQTNMVLPNSGATIEEMPMVSIPM